MFWGDDQVMTMNSKTNLVTEQPFCSLLSKLWLFYELPNQEKFITVKIIFLHKL